MNKIVVEFGGSNLRRPEDIDRVVNVLQSSPQIVVDIVRIQDGRLAEHWDVLQDEAQVAATPGTIAMFDAAEGTRRP